MTPLSQKDPQWATRKLGTCNTTIGASGCLITCFAMMLDKRPDEVNDILRDGGGYVEGCMVDSETAADLLGLNYSGKTTEWQTGLCIAETHDYASKGVPQHFFIWLGDGNIIDPLIGYETTNHYNIVSFRFFEPKEQTMTRGEVEKLEEQLSATDKHQHWVRAALISIAGGSTPSEQQVVTAANNNPDIQAFRQSLIELQCPTCPPQQDCPEIDPYSESVCRQKFPCPECNCEAEVKSEQDRIINNLIK